MSITIHYVFCKLISQRLLLHERKFVIDLDTGPRYVTFLLQIRCDTVIDVDLDTVIHVETVAHV